MNFRSLFYVVALLLLLLSSQQQQSVSLWLHQLQHTRLRCPQPFPGVCVNSCPLSWWCYLTILSPAALSFCLQSFSASVSFPASQLFVAPVVKNTPANAGPIREAGLIPGSGRSPGEGNGSPLQYSCLGKPMNRRAWWTAVHRVTKSWTWLKWLSMHITWPKYWSFNFSISPSNEYSWLVSFKIDWFDLLAVPGSLKSLLQPHNLKASIPQQPTFFMIQLSYPYMTSGKSIALTIWIFIGKVMSLLFNMLSSFVITFLQRSKDLLISCLQSPPQWF